MERKWHVELNEARESDLPGRLEPIGFCRGFVADRENSNAVAKTASNTQELKKKRAMEIGTAPFKSLLQTGFMMWMSGSSVNIFSIMVTGMIIMNTLKSFFNIQTAFTSVNDGVIDLMQPKLVYIAGNLANVALALYKCAGMGLLPTTAADWTWLLPIKQAVETSAYAFDQ
uniref:ER membrane protein complex subunit 4 n=1 Tax=Globisporangium ultimum (strain ATCC 200006 / CBS 805.95 / DAOM BR144) TaxID=431595 RepID=K3WTT5_GLOUD